MRFYLVAIVVAFVMCGQSPTSNKTGSDAEKIKIYISYTATPPDGIAEMACIYADNYLVKTMLCRGTDSIIVSDNAKLHAEYYKKYMPKYVVKDTIAINKMTWNLN